MALTGRHHEVEDDGLVSVFRPRARPALEDVASPCDPSPGTPQKLSPAEAVLAGEVLFPDQDVPWYERSISLPRHFEGPSAPPTYVEVDDLSVPMFTYMVYGLFSGFLIVLILIAIVAYIISFTSREHASR
ncbi:uncharacterized protein LOC142792329 [Rhipicephalus microplus]|uniref:uncharacterized protein LOC142792329 n=1 Tax=Rhipicephalus microplus TaxID=6941 RepID=UPI003F6C7F80